MVGGGLAVGVPTVAPCTAGVVAEENSREAPPARLPS